MTGDPLLSVELRLTLSKTLLSLPDPQFKQLVFALNPPPGILPADQAALGDRAASLLQWAEQSGPGLEVLQQVLSQIQDQGRGRTQKTSLTETRATHNMAVMGGNASQVNDPSGPVFTGPMTGNTININYSGITAPAPTQPQDSPKPDPTYPRFSFEVVTVDPQGQILDRKQASAPYQTIDLDQSVTLEMVLVPGGTFQMGQTKAEQAELIRQIGEKDYYRLFAKELPLHPVTLPAFWMGRYPVTQAQWRAVTTLPRVKQDLDPEPAYFNFKGEQRPVEQVSWEDAMEFCARLSAHSGQTYTLPSETQWEYACRAGTTTPFYFGETITTDLANYRGTDWDEQGKTYPGFYGQGPRGEFRGMTISVGNFPPNGFGLYDMHGNVLEWCLDHYHENYKGAPNGSSAWVTGGNNSYRMLRGGSCSSNPGPCRCAVRYELNLDFRGNAIGFRVVSIPSENS
ncbi:MAG: formylglycine-generating enzyme family protein [Leptolyngbyaceae cyanobacterium]